MQLLIQGCKKNDRESQRLLYKHYYGYAMRICARYCRSFEASKEIVNDGFLKVFSKLEQHDTEASFKGWLRKIMINTAIDHYRKEVKHHHYESIDMTYKIKSDDVSVVDQLSYEELITLIQTLSPAYRTVFNLYVIDGYTHEDIATLLGISIGTSKSNLMKAKENLKKKLASTNNSEIYAKYIG
ncbi:MAG: RNA polymerase sigma factor [Cyclobacteriaceae bacterium]|nr:RNA polymerase sigma factor [Cyclobacteriaceae bacterium]